MATHSSILAWRIPWIEEPGGLQSMGCRVRHYWATNKYKYIYMAFWWLRQERICMQCRRLRFNPWTRKMPWKTEWLPTPVFLSREFYRQGSLAGYSPLSHKESDMTEQLTLSLFSCVCVCVCMYTYIHTIYIHFHIVFHYDLSLDLNIVSCAV